MPEDNSSALVQSGRSFLPEELEEICSTVQTFPGLSLKELARTLCEHLQWHTAAGGPKLDACRKLLVKLERQGRVQLPRKRTYTKSSLPSGKRVYSEQTQPGETWQGRLKELGKVSLEVVHQRPQVRIFNEYIDRHHYLGYRQPFGYTLRYLVVSSRGPVGCVLLSGAAKAVACRDHFIGWNEMQRLKHLPRVVNNSRFLIFPWFKVPHLASHVLGQLARRVRADWQTQWGYQPVLLETFVDPQRFRGTCYLAAGWQELGLSGSGLSRPGRSYKSTPKRMLVRPLVPDFRTQLCGVAGGGEHG